MSSIYPPQKLTRSQETHVALSGWISAAQAVSTMNEQRPHCESSVASTPIKGGRLFRWLPVSMMVPDNSHVDSVRHFLQALSRNQSTMTRKRAFPTIITTFAYFVIATLLLSLCPRSCEACVFQLNGWKSWTLSEKSERADIVVVAEVVSSTKSSTTSSLRYSANCLIKDVSKGLAELLVLNFPNKTVFTIDGFGNPIKCYSDVQVGGLYIMMLNKDNGRLKADYMDGHGGITEYTPREYNVVRQALGWHKWLRWTGCSSTCGENGHKTRRRKCTAPPCNYGTSQQTIACNRWPCDSTIDVLKNIPKLSDRKKRSLEVHGDQVFPRELNNSGFSIYYNISVSSQLLRRYRRFTLLEATQVNTGTSLLSVYHNASILNIKIGRHLRLEVDVSFLSNHTTSKTVLIDFNSTHVSVYINCQYFWKVLDFRQKWSLLTNENVTVHFNRKMRDFVNFFIITTQHNVPPAECLSDVIGDITPPEPKWTTWTICSVTCGTGMQQRSLQCEDSSSDCLSEKTTELRECKMPPCSVQNTEPAVESRCNPVCQNDGTCVKGMCQCQQGYQGAICQIPLCSPKCRNGGVCISRNRCACRAGFTGHDCGKPICSRGCRNSGQCIAPDKCACPPGFRGRRCQHAICISGCQNGGKCIYPNVCSCKYGTYGQYCEKFECYPHCMNGGKCVGFKKCKCKRGFYGKYCHRVKCRHLCMNGGTCTKHGICKCPRGFYGARCDSKNARIPKETIALERADLPRICVRQLKYKKVYKPTVKSFYETVQRRCNRRRNKLCRERRLRSVVVNRIIKKPYFTCVET